MADLDSSSTLAEIKAAFDDNLDYDLEGSVAKCKAFIQAARMLLRRQADEVSHGNDRIRDDSAKIREQLAQADQWLARNDSGAGTRRGTTYFSVEDFRA